MFDIEEKCGIFGMTLDNPSDQTIYNIHLGLFALQHRGQESCGLAYSDGDHIEVIKAKGLVSGDFYKMIPSGVSTKTAIGHVRYSTSGGSNLVNAQPLVFTSNKGELAIAHNGNIPRSELIKNEMIKAGSIFQTTSDTEILIHSMSMKQETDFETALISSLKTLKGAYSILMINKEKIYCFRDVNGFRPLSYGEIDGGMVFASETTALDLIGAKNVKEVNPGELIIAKGREVTVKQYATAENIRQCVFELIYFSRPDSIVFGESVHQVRLKMGAELSHLINKKIDMVLPVPDSGNSAALGFSAESGITFDFGLIRNHYTGRTFIKPGQNKRKESVRIKLNPIRSVIEGKVLAVIDDSLVRGTTSSKIVQILKEAGAKEVHMFLTSPEIKYSCFYGIDTPSREELISSANSPAQIAGIIGADSVSFLPVSKLKSCLKNPSDFCYACFTGDYPTEV